MKRLDQGRTALGYLENEAFLAELETFLLLDGVPGFDDKRRDFENLTVRDNKNVMRVQWLSLCAELGALNIVTRWLGLEVTGFEQKSPRPQGDKTCDVLANSAGQPLFLEVKRNSAEEKQSPPELLKRELRNLPGPYYGAACLIDRSYDCSTLADDVIIVRRYVKGELASGRRPRPFTVGGKFEVLFALRSEAVLAAHFDPTLAEQLEPYLLGGRNKDDKIPMVQEAMRKGADYLMCEIPFWEWREERVVTECFKGCTRVADRTFESSDDRFGVLQGVLLFTSNRDFRIVNNARLRATLKA